MQLEIIISIVKLRHSYVSTAHATHQLLHESCVITSVSDPQYIGERRSVLTRSSASNT